MLPDALFWNVHMYGVMLAVGVLAAFGMLWYCGKKLGYPTKLIDFIYYDGLVSIAVGFGSAALFQSLYNYIEDPSHGFHLGEGITFLGGLIGGAACFIGAYFALRKKLDLDFDLWDTLEIVPCMITVAHGFGRIGCFFAGCCYGKPTDSFLGVKFPELPERVHPTQLYEAAFLFALFGVLLYLLMKGKGRHNFPIYLIAYGIFRFLLEFVRDDPRGKLLGVLTPSQVWSLVMVIAGAALIYMRTRPALGDAETVEAIEDDEAAENDEIVETDETVDE